LFEAYRKVIYGSATPQEPPGLPNFASLAFLLVASLVFLTFTTYVFKRLEPNFAKVI
jgi:ABC-type polysaccharide/polyol phosphate export permease